MILSYINFAWERGSGGQNIYQSCFDDLGVWTSQRYQKFSIHNCG